LIALKAEERMADERDRSVYTKRIADHEEIDENASR
jgi:hypothetical protein